MRLARIGTFGAEKPAVLLNDGDDIDVSDVVHDVDEQFFGSGGLDRIAPIVADRIVNRIGPNDSDHAAETGQAVPSEPILFTTSPNTLVGPNDDVRIPRGATKGMGFSPQTWLQPDDVMELGIDLLGVQRQRVLAPR